MNFWVNFWSIFFFVSLGLFGLLAVVVTIGGFFNIRSLFKSLTERDGQPQDNEVNGTGILPRQRSGD